jgi:hypothetical protein
MKRRCNTDVQFWLDPWFIDVLSAAFFIIAYNADGASMRLPSRSQGRPGFLSSMEFALFFPILVLTLIAIVQFSQVLAVDARLSGASREGARIAACGGDSTQITNAVYATLPPAERHLVTIQTNAVLSDGTPAPLTPGVDVVVRVSVLTKNVVGHPLAFVVANNQELVGQTVMRKE